MSLLASAPVGNAGSIPGFKPAAAGPVSEEKKGPGVGRYTMLEPKKSDSEKNKPSHIDLIKQALPDWLFKELSPDGRDISETFPQVYKYDVIGYDPNPQIVPMGPGSNVGVIAYDEGREFALETHVYVHLTKCKVEGYRPLHRFFETILKDEKYQKYAPDALTKSEYVVELKHYRQREENDTWYYANKDIFVAATSEGYKAYLDIRALREIGEKYQCRKFDVPNRDKVANELYYTITRALYDEAQAGNKLSDMQSYEPIPENNPTLPEKVSTIKKVIAAITDPLIVFTVRDKR